VPKRWPPSIPATRSRHSLHAFLRHLVDILSRDQVNPPLAAGEIVTTGTLTRALPVSAGETWTTELTGVALDGICVHFA
jgi:2-oxo-3-hexenedioate decarboxylase